MTPEETMILLGITDVDKIEETCKEMSPVKALRLYMSSGTHGRVVNLPELKPPAGIDPEVRTELGEMCKVALANGWE